MKFLPAFIVLVCSMPAFAAGSAAHDSAQTNFAVNQSTWWDETWFTDNGFTIIDRSVKWDGEWTNIATGTTDDEESWAEQITTGGSSYGYFSKAHGWFFKGPSYSWQLHVTVAVAYADAQGNEKVKGYGIGYFCLATDPYDSLNTWVHRSDWNSVFAIPWTTWNAYWGISQ